MSNKDTPLTSDTAYIPSDKKHSVIATLKSELAFNEKHTERMITKKNAVIRDLRNRLTVMEDAYEAKFEAAYYDRQEAEHKYDTQTATLTKDLANVTDAFLKLQDEVRGTAIDGIVAIALQDEPLSDDEYLESVKMNAPSGYEAYDALNLSFDEANQATSERLKMDAIKAAVMCADSSRTKRLNASFPESK